MPVLSLNPLFAAIDVIRSPLLGKVPLAYSWPVLLVVTVVGSVGTFGLFDRASRIGSRHGVLASTKPVGRFPDLSRE